MIMDGEGEGDDIEVTRKCACVCRVFYDCISLNVLHIWTVR
jgi:hypothetical protein